MNILEFFVDGVNLVVFGPDIGPGFPVFVGGGREDLDYVFGRIFVLSEGPGSAVGFEIVQQRLRIVAGGSEVYSSTLVGEE